MITHEVEPKPDEIVENILAHDQQPPPPPSQPPSFLSLPDEIVENILARVSRWSYPCLSLVSKRFHSLLSSTQIYKTRAQIGAKERCFYVCLQLPDHPNPSWFTLWTKPFVKPKPETEPEGEERLGFNKDPNGNWVIPTPFSSFHSPPLPHFSRTVGSEIYLIGGLDEAPSSSVWVLDCQSHTWREAPSMNVARDNPCVALLEGKIYVMGGCDIDDYSTNWFEVFDINTRSWTALPGPGPDEDQLRNDLRENGTYYFFHTSKGKIYVATEERKYTYNTKDGSWEVISEQSSSFLPQDTVSWYNVGKIIYSCNGSGCLMWSDSSNVEGREWKEIKGLENFGHKSHVHCMDYYDGKIWVMWDPDYDNTCTGRKNKIWYAKISVETRSSSNGHEVLGKVECVDVLTFPDESYEFVKLFHVMV